MKVLKWIGIILLVVIVVGLVASLIMPKKVEAEATVMINASPETVWPLMSSLRAANEWSPWADLDTAATVEFSGEPGTVGEKQMWEGSGDMGKGEMEIAAIDPMKRVETNLHFMEPRDGKANAWLTMEPEGEGTKVSWGFSMDAPVPFNLLMTLGGMKGAIKKEYQKGLNKLKDMAEKKAAMPDNEIDGYTIEEGTVDAKTYLAIRKTVGWDEIGNMFQIGMPALGAELEKQKLQMVGAPSGIYWSWDEENKQTDMAVAMPIAAQANGGGEMSVITLPASNVIMSDYYGSYEEMEPIYTAMDMYVKQHMLEQGEVVVEEYLTDPMSEPDTAKWHTRVIFYIK